jgi:hypothetical protein
VEGILHIKRERVVIDIEQGNVRYLPNPEITERSEKNLCISTGPIHDGKVK